MIAFRRRSPWTPVLGGAPAAALVCDAWFDVMTSDGSDRSFAVGLALFAELPVAVLAAVVGVRSVPARGSSEEAEAAVDDQCLAAHHLGLG